MSNETANNLMLLSCRYPPFDLLELLQALSNNLCNKQTHDGPNGCNGHYGPPGCDENCDNSSQKNTTHGYTGPQFGYRGQSRNGRAHMNQNHINSTAADSYIGESNGNRHLSNNYPTNYANPTCLQSNVDEEFVEVRRAYGQTAP